MGFFEGWHIVVLLLVALLIFGSKRLPGAARSLGQSLRIFKAETSGLRNAGDQEDSTQAQSAAPQPLPAPQPTVNSTTAGTQAPQTQPTNQSS
jgi:sec-independent protein translocase protein TatA